MRKNFWRKVSILLASLLAGTFIVSPNNYYPSTRQSAVHQNKSREILAPRAGFCKNHPADCNRVTSFFQKHKAQIATLLSDRNKDQLPFIFAMVSPEVAKYNSFRDDIETQALEILYLRVGTVYANFSIGHFQMKPSFIEEMEQYVKDHSFLEEFAAIAEHEYASQKFRRMTRLERLKSLEWQIRYLDCYYTILEEVYYETEFDSLEAKLKHYATAYNLGFSFENRLVEEWKTRKTFPNLPFYDNYNYSDLSLLFYAKINKLP